MDMPLKKRKQVPGPPTMKHTGPDPATPASRCFLTGDAGQIPLDVTGNGSKTCKDYMASGGASSEFEEFQSGDQIPERLDTPQGAAGEPLHPDPVHLTTAPILGGDSPVTSFTIPPTEEDLKLLQSAQDKNGYIKRPPNAFIVWSRIHRQYALHEICPGANMIDTSIVLGCEWSKLSEEQKRPYQEVSHKLKCMHKEQFPDYKFRRQQKKDIECFSSGQGAGQDPGISFSQAVPPAQFNLKGPSMYPYPPMMPYTVGYYPYPPFTPCHQMGLFSTVSNNHPRFFYTYPNTSSSTEEVRNYHNSYPERDETTSESLEQPDIDTRPQLSAITKVEC